MIAYVDGVRTSATKGPIVSPRVISEFGERGGGDDDDDDGDAG